MNKNELDDLYILPDRKAVYEYIHAHPELARILFDAYEPLVEAFGPFPQVQLAVVHDPEIPVKAELSAAILTPLNVLEALARLKQFDQRWFLRRLKQVNGHLTFDIEFV